MDNGPLSHFPLPATSPPLSFRKSYSFVKVQCDTFVGYYHAVICKNTQIEGEQAAVVEPEPVTERALTLLDKLGQDGLNDEQRQILIELRRCLRQQDTTNTDFFVNVQTVGSPEHVPYP